MIGAPTRAMIGVAARMEERDAAREFFELFKTSWEFCRSGERYTVILQTDPAATPPPADLILLFGTAATAFDDVNRRLPGPARPAVLSSPDGPLPVYAGVSAFSPDGLESQLLIAGTSEPAAWASRGGGSVVIRIGYDLFREVRLLLTTGQPPEYATVPTLERHIALLRRWIVGAGLVLAEIPPVPDGHPFMVCLTHDLDHPALRFHGLDHTTLGFLHRAVIGSLVNVCQGRLPIAAMRRNIAAALRLPFVHLGWADDFWFSFDRYLDIEQGCGSTFFAIPHRGKPGRARTGVAPKRRASAYGATDIADRMQELATAGCEIGVHGIDAWIDAASGAAEREAVSTAALAPAKGVRMHWLYFDEAAPARLEEAGFEYDSTFGYNEAVGFRPGTLQAFKPLSARDLLELPLHIMDTSLFYPSHLHLTPDQAKKLVFPLVHEAVQHGGALTVNWHDRSIAPERLWDGFYLDLLNVLKRHGPWFPTAGEAVAWFRRRRAARIETVRHPNGSVAVKAHAEMPGNAPALTLRVHVPIPASTAARGWRRAACADLALKETVETTVPAGCRG